MAKAENGLFGPVKGRVANVIFSSNLGTPYVRSRPQKRKAGNTKEKNTRQGFGDLSWDFIKPIQPFLKLSFREVARGDRGVFAARSYLLKQAVVRDAENNTSIVPSQMLISRGSLGMAEDVQVELNEDQLDFSWNKGKANGPINNDDQLLLVAYNVEAAKAVTAVGPACRRDGNASLSLQDLPTGKIHVYLGFISHDRSKASDSVYLGELEI